LWPASGAGRPKQFLQLLGPISSFQEAVLRARALPEAADPLIIAGAKHLPHIRAQLAELGAQARVLLEPEARDSAAAVAAAAAWIETEDPDAVAVILSADHHLPDHAAFAAAIGETLEAARNGAVVTLGVRPSAPATSYGYIRASEGKGPVKPVAAFVEKPDAARAEAYVADGYLWNSGYFVASAKTLVEELEAYAPEILAAARAGVAEAEADGEALMLGQAFCAAPKASIDYAVMEKTSRAAVLSVDFTWSDLGAWDAIWAAAAKDEAGNALTRNSQALDARNNLVVAPDHVHVALLGAHGLGVIVEGDAVLVCDLEESQRVRTVAGAAPPAADSAPGFASLDEAAAWYDLWLRTAALPLWATAGVDAASGAFRESLDLDGRPREPFRRARVQARQVFVYATAASAGIDGPWLAAAERGYEQFVACYRRPDHLFANKADLEGRLIDETAPLYEQAFALLAMAALHRAGRGDLADEAAQTREALQALRHSGGGFRELGAHPYQANATMHLLEAALAWDELDVDPAWGKLADQLVALARGRFIDPDHGFLREFFDADWRPASGDDGRLVEPGHQFEWAWLLERWGRAQGDEGARAAARRLFQAGLQGLDRVRNVAVNELWDDLSVRDAGARLWPQTERLKAALWLGDDDEAVAAAEGLARYLDAPARGAWRDKLRADGSFVEEPAPASSFYHLIQALLPLIGRRKTR
jgi:mannose-1-phosphate guanylyltransferase/mannose-6-phosphate isomerase